METKEVNIQHRDTTVSQCLLRVSREAPWRVELSGLESKTFGANGEDLPSALKVLRQELEALGMRILINGARKDVVCSGMSRSMGGGRKACIVQIGQPANRDDLVDVLDPVEVQLVSSIESQENFYREWVKSLDER